MSSGGASQLSLPGGLTVLSLPGNLHMRSEFIAEVLQDMASQGVVGAEDIDADNIPVYTPCQDELRGVVEREGSFEILSLESYDYIMNGPRGDAMRSAAMAMSQRAVHESTLVRHFRIENIWAEFARAAEARYMGAAAKVDSKFAIRLLSEKIAI